MGAEFSRSPADWLAASPSARRVRSRIEAEAGERRPRRRRACRCRGRVKAVLIVGRVDRLGDLGLDFDADLVRGEDVAPERPSRSPEREHRGSAGAVGA